MFLLDTNHCFRIVARDADLLRRLERVPTEPLFTSVIVAGELTYGASISQRRDENLAAVLRFLDAIEIVSISPNIAGAYGRLKGALLERFGPREPARRRNFDLSKLGFSDHDLWIAATAIDLGAVIVSADSHFARITEVAHLGVVNWT